MEVILHQNLKYAYLGDAYYEVSVRKYLNKKYPSYSMDKLHKENTFFSCCGTQSAIIKKMQDENFLNDEELEIFKLARNEKTSSHPKNFTVNEYRNATGFEAVIGYLTVNENYKRADEIIEKAISIAEELNNEK